MLWPCVAVLLLQVLLTLDWTATSPIQPNKGVVVSELIRYSEPAVYDPLPVSIGNRRRRTVDTVPYSEPIRISFHALHRDFRLVLHPDSHLFANDAVFDSSLGHLDFDTARIYKGVVEGEPDSSVEGLLTRDGLFDGTITSRGETFYVEPVSRYGSGPISETIHTIIYRTTDVENPMAERPCASQTLHERKKRSVDARDVGGSPVLRTFLQDTDKGRNIRWKVNVTSPRSPRPSTPVNAVNRPRAPLTPLCDSDASLRHVSKRATIDPKKTTCMLYLQADHLFFQKYGTEEACIEVMTRHVQRVNAIYRTTDFNQDGRSDNISFMIKRIKVHTIESTNEPGYRFPGNYGVEKFLELFSEEDYDAFCLAYMFTYRDFEMGTLGLAWTGDLKNAGGVCEKNGHYRGSLKSLNTGIVTLLNYGKHVPPAVSHVTLAHEIGHNFGSPHDPEICTPGGEDGNYIMFARATSGDKRNNNKFSPCSLNSINPVLNTKARSHMGCFTEPQSAICGNGVVEVGEECDCGWEEDCRDSCCFPQRRYPPAGEPPCRLTPHSVCSPSQGPCCTSECQLKFGDKCRDDNGCRDSSFCNGRTPSCPPSVNKPNKTICNEEFVCFMGECTGSICLAYGLESCQCMPGPQDVDTKACELCCKKPGDDQPCLSSFEWNEVPYDVPDMFSKPGTPCSDYNGYCDVFQKCREVDPSGPLATLRKLLLSEESIASFKKWVSTHWYAVLVIVTTVLLLLILSTKLLGKQSDAKLKSITIIHSATTEAVRLPSEGEGAVTMHPTAIRSKLPLHRKVREKKLHTKVASRRKKTGKHDVGVEGKKFSKEKEVGKSKKYRREMSGESRQIRGEDEKKSRESKLDQKIESKLARPNQDESKTQEPKHEESKSSRSLEVVNDKQLKDSSQSKSLRHAPTEPKSSASEKKDVAVSPSSAELPSPIYENIKVASKSDDHNKLSTGKLISSRLKRSNRVSAEISSDGAKKLKGESSTAKKETRVPTVRKSERQQSSPVKRKKKRKEVIEYKSSQGSSTAVHSNLPADDPVGKVHNWLLQSISNSKGDGVVSLVLPKSKSSPVGLSAAAAKTKRVVQIPKLTQKRSRSAGNLRREEKVKLQVVYRPPWRLSVRRVVPERMRPVPRTAILLTSTQPGADDIDSNVHTVPSDRDVLLYESDA